VGNARISATLSALARDQKLKVLSSPRLTALNNQKAILRVVREQAYFLSSSQTSGAGSLEPTAAAPNPSLSTGLTDGERQKQLLQTLGVAGGTVSVALLISIFLVFVRPRLQEVPLPVRLERSLRKRNMAVPRWLLLWSQYASLTPFELAFTSLGQALWLLRQPVLPAQTPAERVNLLAETLPGAGLPAKALLKEYERAEYSSHFADLPRARYASAQVRQLALRAFIRRLFRLHNE